MGPRTTSDPFGECRILCVDDQIFNIEFLRCQLELIPTLQGRCDYTNHGAQAIELCEKSLKNCRGEDPYQTYYKLILLDYSMPDLDGPATAHKILALFAKE